MSTVHDTHKRIKEMKPLQFYLIYFSTIALPTTALIVASIVILAIYWNTTCDGSWMPLPVWLLVFAIFEFIYLVKSAMSAYYRKTNLGAKSLTYGVGINQLFMIIWNIIGAVAFYQDSASCQTATYPLWAMMFAILIIQWIIFSCLFLICCCACCGACCIGIATGWSGKK